MGLNEEQFPVKRTVRATSDPVEIKFESRTKYKSHAVVNHGDRVMGVINRDGDTVDCPHTCREWEEVCPGVEFRTETDYMQISTGTGFEDQRWMVRIAACALPVRILVRDQEAWSCKRNQTSRGANHSVIVE